MKEDKGKMCANIIRFYSKPSYLKSQSLQYRTIYKIIDIK